MATQFSFHVVILHFADWNKNLVKILVHENFNAGKKYRGADNENKVVKARKLIILRFCFMAFLYEIDNG